MGYRVRPTPTNAATLKNSAFVTLTLRTRPEDCRTNSFGVVVRAAADCPEPAGPGAPGPALVSATVSLLHVAASVGPVPSSGAAHAAPALSSLRNVPLIYDVLEEPGRWS